MDNKKLIDKMKIDVYDLMEERIRLNYQLQRLDEIIDEKRKKIFEMESMLNNKENVEKEEGKNELG